MNMTGIRRTAMCLALILSVAAAAYAGPDGSAEATTQPAKRLEVTAFRVPDGTITIDGRDDDWSRAGDALARCKILAEGNALWGYAIPDRGEYRGPDDCSAVVQLAHDSNNFYVLADVHDQFLINTSDENHPWFGDDFELFIDANPPDARFADKPNENVRQLVFVPAYVNPKWTKTFIWDAKRNPGVEAASRLRPWGYTIEIKIPKALFPAWKANPDMASIGFDGMCGDADSPGVDFAHPAVKGNLFFLTVDMHHKNPKALSLAKLEKDPVTLKPKVTVRPLPEEPWSDQGLLDYLGNNDTGRLALTVLTDDTLASAKAPLFIFSHCPDLKIPAGSLQKFSKVAEVGQEEANHPGYREIAEYAMMAMAVRGKLPAKDLFKLYGRCEDKELRLTYLWSCGVNKDAAIVPDLLTILDDKNIRMRMMAIWALGEIGDKSVVEELNKIAEKDKESYVKGQAADALKKLGAATTQPEKH
jgi:hypothetical protein